MLPAQLIKSCKHLFGKQYSSCIIILIKVNGEKKDSEQWVYAFRRVDNGVLTVDCKKNLLRPRASACEREREREKGIEHSCSQLLSSIPITVLDVAVFETRFATYHYLSLAANVFEIPILYEAHTHSQRQTQLGQITKETVTHTNYIVLVKPAHLHHHLTINFSVSDT